MCAGAMHGGVEQLGVGGGVRSGQPSRYVPAATPVRGGRAATRWTGCGRARLLAGHRPARKRQIAEVTGLIAEPAAVVDLFDCRRTRTSGPLRRQLVCSRSHRMKEASWPTPGTTSLSSAQACVRAPPTSGRDSPGGPGRPSASCVRCRSVHTRRARHRPGPPYRCGVVFDDGCEARVARVLVFVQVGLLGAQALLRGRQDWPTPTRTRRWRRS